MAAKKPATYTLKSTSGQIHIDNIDNEINLKHTFFNGQCFNWKEIEPNLVVGVIGQHLVELKLYSEGNNLLYTFTPQTEEA